MGTWLEVSIVLVSGLMTGVLFRWLYGLIHYIRYMDAEEPGVCDACQNREACIAMKAIGSSNWVTEFTFTTYLSVKKQCVYTKEQSRSYMLVFMILNSVLYGGLYAVYGWNADTVLYCLTATALLYIGAVDWNTQYIPAELNIFIFILGLIRLCLGPERWLEQVIGLFAVSLFLLLVDFIGTKIWNGNHVVGGGDIKLMAAAGLLLGWKLNIVAFMMGCIGGSIIHLIIMKIGKGEHRLAFGPYLAMGIYIAMICGEQLMSWYLGIMGL